MSRQKRSTKQGSCKICGKPQLGVLSSRGKNKHPIVRYGRTCGDPKCRQAAMKGTHGCFNKICIACKKAFSTRSTRKQTCQTCVPHQKAANMWRNFRLSWPAYCKLKETAKGLCEICGNIGRCVDHNHTTGHIRGWLCNRCNLMLPAMEQPISWQEKAKAYLARSHNQL